MSTVLFTQYGRVASRSVNKALVDALGGRNVYCSHALGTNYTNLISDSITANDLRSGDSWESSMLLPVVKNIEMSTDYIARKHESGSRVKVITGVRNPIERSISLMFHTIRQLSPTFNNLDDAAGYWVKTLQEFYKKVWRLNPDDVDVGAIVEKVYYYGFYGNKYWFDDSILKMFDIDISGKPDKHVAAGGIYSSEKADVLVYKFEQGFDVIEESITEFLGLKERVSIPWINSVDAQDQRSLHKRFRESLLVDDDLCALAFSDPVSRRWYSEADILSTKRKFSGSELG